MLAADLLLPRNFGFKRKYPPLKMVDFQVYETA